jgi:hypothetical protein
VNDSSTVNGATASGYGYFFWNNQKAVPSWQFWDGTSLVNWNPSTSGAVTSVFGRTGVITGQAGDYTADEVTNIPAGTIAATEVQAAINELDAEKQVTLVSATNIKTINGTTLLGSGDLVVGSSSTLTLNVQAASYTLQLTDQTSLTEVVMNVGTANNLTVPPNSSVAFPIGTQILVRQTGAGLTTFVQGSGVTIVSSSGGLTMPGQNYSALLIKTGTDTWSLDNGAPALIASDITTALTFTPWSTTGTTNVTTPTITQTLAGSGTTKFLTLTAAAHTGQTASTELTDLDFDLKAINTFSAGALTLNRSVLIQPRTLAFSSASTVTDAYTLYVGTAANTSGAPIAGTNATITNAYALGAKTTSSSFVIRNTLANFSKFGGTGLVIQNGSIVLSNSASDPTLSNTIQVGTVSNVNSITSASSSNPITYSSVAHTQTSGAFVPHNFVAGVGPTSGTASYKYMSINGTTNQTGGANGNVTILAVEPTWTAAGGIPIGIDYNPTGTPANHRALVIRPTDAVSGFATGSTLPNSTVQVNGSFSTAYVAKTGTYTLTSLDYVVEVTSGTHTQTLPTAVGITGRIYVITNSGAGVVTVGTTSSQTFINVTATPTTLTLNQFETATVTSNGANWLRL